MIYGTSARSFRALGSPELQQLVGVDYDGRPSPHFLVHLAKVIEFSGLIIIVGVIILAAVPDACYIQVFIIIERLFWLRQTEY